MTTGRPYLNPTEQRDCRLYRIRVLDPRTNYRTVCERGYIGETARMPFTRFIEHLYEQPWGDTIVGHPTVDPRVFRSKEQVWVAEEAAIRAERPLYNYEHNLDNTDRIKVWQAREQRWERDRKAGRPLWQAGDRTQQAAVLPAPRGAVTGRVSAPRFRWTTRRVWAAVLAGLWLALAVTVMVWTDTHARIGLRDSAAIGGLTPSALYLVVWRLFRPKRRRRRRRR